MIKILVGTTNPSKIEAVRSAFERYFQNLEIEGLEVDSKVPSQPLNDQVFEGAENRIKELKKKCREWDYIVSCEGGMIYQYGHWFNVQVVKVETRNGKEGIGLSQGFEIPSEYVKEAQNTSIAKVLDRLFEGKGGISVLSKGCFNRKNLIEDGVVMALTKVINGDVW